MTQNSPPTLVPVDRRMTLRWLGAAIASGQLAACGQKFGNDDWLAPPPIKAKGYGTDPNLLEPTVPWPLTLTRNELMAAAALADVILPREGDAPSASEVGVPAFIDEWVSAPYPAQQQHRALIVPGLAWLDREAMDRGGQRFSHVTDAVRKSIADDIAFNGKVKPELEKAGEFFARMRALTLGAYYTTQEGWKDIGYPGANPILGPYPGPTPEAVAHVKALVESMGLKFAFEETGKL
jgi:hypothetical protein